MSDISVRLNPLITKKQCQTFEVLNNGKIGINVFKVDDLIEASLIAKQDHEAYLQYNTKELWIMHLDNYEDAIIVRVVSYDKNDKKLMCTSDKSVMTIKLQDIVQLLSAYNLIRSLKVKREIKYPPVENITH